MRISFSLSLSHTHARSWLTVHLDEDFGLDPAAGLVFVRRPSPPADGVDLVYEDGGRSVEPSLELNKDPGTGQALGPSGEQHVT